MNLSFRKVNDSNQYWDTIDRLTADVVENGGSACEIINMHNRLIIITMCAVPNDATGQSWSVLQVREEVDQLGAWAWLLREVE